MAVVVALVGLCTTARAERWPVRQFTTADGLPHDRISRIVADSRGMLWFCTGNGLGRFDGSRFVNYLPPGTNVSDIVEAPDGTYWIGVWRGGLYRLDPNERDPDKVVRPVEGDYTDAVRKLVFDGSGRLWIGTGGGLFTVDRPRESTEVRWFPLPGEEGRPGANIWDLAIDERDQVWIAYGQELWILSPSGELEARNPHPANPVQVNRLLLDSRGRMWTGHDRGVTILDPRSPDEPRWHGPEVVGKGIINGIFEASDGTVWINRYKEGLTRYDANGFHRVPDRIGIASWLLRSVAEDIAGNLWIGTEDAGAFRLAPTGFTAYDHEDGLAFSRYASLIEDRDGRIVVAAGHALYALEGTGFAEIRPAALRGLDTGRQGDNPVILQDSAGAWWIGTPHGLFRYAPSPVGDLGSARPDRVLTRAEGLPRRRITTLFEDSRGDVWIGTDSQGLTRWDRASDSLQVIDAAPRSAPRSVAEDAAGNVWVGFDRGVARCRDDRCVEFGEAEGLTVSRFVYGLLRDGQDRLWISSIGSGVNRVDDPTALQPQFASVNGVEDRFVWSAVEDAQGRIYFGTLNGVVRLDPTSGRLRRFTTADGLSSNEICYGMRDSTGAIWFTSVRGVSRIVPRPSTVETLPPPEVWITGLRIAGVSHPVAALGERIVDGIRIAPRLGRLEVDYGGIDFEMGRPVRYQYKLERGSGEWSAPTSQRTVHYAGLAAGNYRFVVRTVGADGTTGAAPAVVGFEVLAPLWQRPWFLSLAAIALAGIVFAGHRYRTSRLIELERMRTRIASDLHDDIGSSLSQIAILSEIAQRNVGQEADDVRAPLKRIAEGSRELVDSMSDIVWAINPRRDNLDDVVHRMRRFASDALAPSDIELEFHADAGDGRLPLGPELRRELYLIFKECVHNVLKHSKCRHVTVRVELANRRVRMSVRDDGRGFDPASRSDGHGLASMASRARRLGGQLVIDSTDGTGTSISLEIPVRRGAP